MIKFKNIYADGVDYFVVLEETAGLSVSTKQRHNISNATALNVL